MPSGLSTRATGWNARLDELRGLRDASRRHVLGLQERYATETGAPQRFI